MLASQEAAGWGANKGRGKLNPARRVPQGWEEKCSTGVGGPLKWVLWDTPAMGFDYRQTKGPWPLLRQLTLATNPSPSRMKGWGLSHAHPGCFLHSSSRVCVCQTFVWNFWREGQKTEPVAGGICVYLARINPQLDPTAQSQVVASSPCTLYSAGPCWTPSQSHCQLRQGSQMKWRSQGQQFLRQ